MSAIKYKKMAGIFLLLTSKRTFDIITKIERKFAINENYTRLNRIGSTRGIIYFS